MADTVLDSPACDSDATGKRKAWASSKGSCPASETDDSIRTQDHVAEGLPLDVEMGERRMQNEKIATWLKDCRTPMRSFDESYNSAFKGTNLKNGGSFDDDLSLGAEANHLLPGRLQGETACNGLLAEKRRLLFHKRGSMNSTESGKSSGTVSSVSELLELYEEDPEEVLYNLGFGRDEPDIASKIPSRFFSSSSCANGIDIKVYLNAQLQRMELENPNYALTSRFRQIEVLTTVANAFSSLYSQVSGVPLQKIGSATTDKDTVSDVPPLKRSGSRNTVALLKKTISKLNLQGAAKDNGSSPNPAETGGSTDIMGTEEIVIKHGLKNEQKQMKLFKRETPLLATVKEEASVNSLKSVKSLPVSPLCKENGATTTDQTPEGQHPQNAVRETPVLKDTSLLGKDTTFSDEESEMTTNKTEQYTSTPDKEQYAHIQNPVLVNLTAQQKDSFEIEEILSIEGEVPHVSASSSSRNGKDQFYRTTSSDSSGFAEDPSSDYHSANHLQVQESLRTMGSSGDSNDSETTLTSYAEPISTPLSQDEPFFQEPKESEEFFTPVDKLDGMPRLFPANEPSDLEGEIKLFPSSSEMEHLNQSEGVQMSMPNESDCKGEVFDSEDLHCKEQEDSVLLKGSEHSEESDSEVEIPQYTIHSIPESLDLTEDSCSCISEELDDLSPSSVSKINIALQRAQNRSSHSSAGSPARIGRSLVKASDLFIADNELSARNESKIELGYPLRRTRSLPSTLLSPVRVVSSVSVRLAPGSKTHCTPPLYTYRYTPEDSEGGNEDDDSSSTKSALFTSPECVTKEAPSRSPLLNKFVDESCHSRVHSYPLYGPKPLSQSTYSLHSEMLEKPVYDHLRTWSSSSVPNVAHHSYTTSSFCSPYPQRHFVRPYQMLPLNPPTTVEMQLRRVLHDIRNTVQNLSQYQMFGVNDHAASCCNARASILPLYESTSQELKIMKRSLNLFRSQMMDLELNMLHQQTMVYHHLTEEERQEADQLQYLRNSVRMELQELEQQLEERIFAVEEQLRASRYHSPYRPRMYPGVYECRSLDNLSCSSPLNVLEPVTELLREQSYLKSELGLVEPDFEDAVHGSERIQTCTPSLASELASVHSSPTPMKRSTVSTPRYNRETISTSPQTRQVFRASLTLTPEPPLRTGKEQSTDSGLTSEAVAHAQIVRNQRIEHTNSSETHDADQKRTLTESPGLQEVLKEIKQSIVGEIKRELVEGLLAAVSSQDMSPGVKREGCL